MLTISCFKVHDITPLNIQVVGRVGVELALSWSVSITGNILTLIPTGIQWIPLGITSSTVSITGNILTYSTKSFNKDTKHKITNQEKY